MSLFGILANPVSGVLSRNAKYKRIKRAKEVLGPDCMFVGFDTTSAEEFREAGRDLADKVEHIVVAGGDGSVHDTMQGISLGDHILSVLPLGTGNALKYAFNIPWNPEKAAARIKSSDAKSMDLILHEESGGIAYLASVGIDGHILNAKNERKDTSAFWNQFPFLNYAWSTTVAALGAYEKPEATVSVDKDSYGLNPMLSVMITKIPNYGMGLKVAPQTKQDDGLLHVTAIQGGLVKAIGAATTSYLGGNRVGTKTSGQEVAIQTNGSVYLQLDGEVIGNQTDCFSFKVLPNAINWKY